ncbi:hypothetical protein As57867_003132, partial [Aphanomyces stellatus]
MDHDAEPPSDEQRTDYNLIEVAPGDRNKWRRAAALAGVIYVVATNACGIGYVVVLTPSMTNDFYWAVFNATGLQSFVVDAYNGFLPTAASGAVNLVSPTYASPKDYSSASTLTNVNIAYTRFIQNSQLTDLTVAIMGLRSTPSGHIVGTQTQYCWLDFNRTWSLAHTALRQQRCDNRAFYQTNGAMYLESLLRNLIWTDFMSTYGVKYIPGIVQPLSTQVTGQTFLASLSNRTATTVAAEVAYWQSKGVMYYNLQWQNRLQLALVDTISVVNALGLTQQLTIKGQAKLVDRKTIYSSKMAYWGILNDLNLAQTLNGSLVRGNGHIFSRTPDPMIAAIGLTTPLNVPCSIISSTLGPLGSIDANYIAPTPHLKAFFWAFRSILAQTLAADAALSQAFLAIPTMSVHPTPPQWTVGNIKFYGGSPLCGQGTAQLFVQRSFGFDDACTAQVAYTVPFSPSSLLFAMIATASTTPQSTCALVAPPTEAALCTSVLNLLATTIPISVFASLELSQATAEASNLNLELIQLALNGSTQALL